MKTQITNGILGLIMTIGGLLVMSGNSAHARVPGGQCNIYLYYPCANYPTIQPRVYFKDSASFAHNNGARCLQRAAEYYSYCGDPNGRQIVVSNYTVNGVSVIHGVKSKGSSYTAGPGSVGWLGVITLGQ